MNFTKNQLISLAVVAILFIAYTVYRVYFEQNEHDIIKIEQVSDNSPIKETKSPNHPNTKVKKEYDKSKKSQKNFQKIEQKPEKITTPNAINLNTATIEELKNVSYIGEKTATKIVEYREKLGGFVEVDQLSEIIFQDLYEKIPIEVFFVDTTQVKKLKIKDLTKDELAQHPYINYRLAKKFEQVLYLHRLRSEEDLWLYFEKDEIKKYLLNYLDFSQ